MCQQIKKTGSCRGVNDGYIMLANMLQKFHESIDITFETLNAKKGNYHKSRYDKYNERMYKKCLHSKKKKKPERGEDERLIKIRRIGDTNLLLDDTVCCLCVKKGQCG